MSKELFNLASTNFDKYLKNFKENDADVLLPYSRLTDSQWDQLNAELESENVIMYPVTRDGKKYMSFSWLAFAEEDNSLFNLASTNFDKHLKNFKENDADVLLPYSRLTDSQWDQLNAELESENVIMYPVTRDGKKYMSFSWLAVAEEAIAEPKKIVARDAVMDSFFDEYDAVDYKGVPVFVYAPDGLGQGNAEGYAEKIMANGEYYATSLKRTGEPNGNCVLIAIKKSDAKKIGAVYQDDVLTEKMDNSAAHKKLSQIYGRPLTYINGVPAMVESSADFGVFHGRPVALVTVGKKKIPFYISSGSAGKTEVLAGKWGFFGGITGDHHLRKGFVEDIVAHYRSPELKQIANALDEQIGDVRDTVDVLKTVGRKYLGGVGVVAKMSDGPEISRARINSDIFFPENDGILLFDIRSMTDYIKSLNRQQYLEKNNKFKNGQAEFEQAKKYNVDNSAKLDQGSKKLKSKLLKIFTFGNNGKSND